MDKSQQDSPALSTKLSLTHSAALLPIEMMQAALLKICRNNPTHLIYVNITAEPVLPGRPLKKLTRQEKRLAVGDEYTRCIHIQAGVRLPLGLGRIEIQSTCHLINLCSDWWEPKYITIKLGDKEIYYFTFKYSNDAGCRILKNIKQLKRKPRSEKKK